MMDAGSTTIILATATILAVIGTGIALAAAIMPSLRDLRRTVGKLGERVARLEVIVDNLQCVPDRLARIESYLVTKDPTIRHVFLRDEAPPEEPEAPRCS